jgi:sRNA-binding protein
MIEKIEEDNMSKHPTIIQGYRPTRVDAENTLKMLYEHYPKTFFEEVKQRRPLKHDIKADLIADPDFDVSPLLINFTIDWYTNHISYAYATQTAGVKRVDLEGREVGTVTEQEAIAAQQELDKFHKIKNEQAAAAQSMNMVQHTPTLTIPPRSKTQTAAPEFALLYETLATANAAVTGINDPAMRLTVAKATLDAVIKKCQEVRQELGE